MLLQEELAKLNIKFHLGRGTAFVEQQAVQDAVALLQLTQTPDDSLAFKRMLNKPSRRLGEPRSLRCTLVFVAHSSSLASRHVMLPLLGICTALHELPALGSRSCTYGIESITCTDASLTC